MNDYFTEKIKDSDIWKYFQKELPKHGDGSIFNNFTVPNDSREAMFIQILEDDWLEVPRGERTGMQNNFRRVMDLLKETEIYRTVRTHYEDMQRRISQTNLRQAQQNRQGNTPNQPFDEKFSQVWFDASGFQHFYIGGLNRNAEGSGLHSWQGLYALQEKGRLAIQAISKTNFENLSEVDFKRDGTGIRKSILFGLPFEYEMLVLSLPLLFPDNDNTNTYKLAMRIDNTWYNYCVSATPDNQPSIISAYFVKKITQRRRPSSKQSA